MSTVRLEVESAPQGNTPRGGARIEGDKVVLPAEFEPVVRRFHFRLAIEFLASVDAFPTEIAQLSGLSLARLASLTSRLRGELRKHFPDNPEFKPIEFKPRGMGALPPNKV